MPDTPVPTSPATRGSLLVVFLTVFIDLLGFGMVLPLLPVYADQFTLDESGWLIGLLMASFSTMQFLFAPVWGRLSDRIGRRPVLMIGLAGSVVFYSIFGLATSFRSLTWLFVSRIGAGIAGATIPTAQAYIADTTTPDKRARGMALIGAAFGLGFTFGPLLAYTALWTAGDRGLSPWPGYTAAGLSAVALLLAIFKLPESLRPDSRPSERKLFNVAGLKKALAIPTMGALLTASFLSILSFATLESLLTILLASKPERGGFGYVLRDVLPIFAVLGLVTAFVQGGVRSLSKRYSEESLASLGAAVSIVAFVIVIWATLDRSFAGVMAAAVTSAAGFAFMPPTLQSLISRRSDPRQQGEILGVGQSLNSLARILGHGISFPLFFVHPTVPFAAGGLMMVLALGLIATRVRGGRDFAEASAI